MVHEDDGLAVLDSVTETLQRLTVLHLLFAVSKLLHTQSTEIFRIEAFDAKRNRELILSNVLLEKR